eukprot:scaffold99031_cov16-Tisochrysis_lutea.AAC.1
MESMREWSDEELRMLDKAVAKFPQGSTEITHTHTHGLGNIAKSVSSTTFLAVLDASASTITGVRQAVPLVTATISPVIHCDAKNWKAGLLTAPLITRQPSKLPMREGRHAKALGGGGCICAHAQLRGGGVHGEGEAGHVGRALEST